MDGGGQALGGTDDARSAASRRGGRRPGAGRPRQPGADERILEATVEMLNRIGYGDLRVDDVAERAQVAKSTVYRRWSSKPALIAAAVERLYLDRVTVPDTGSLSEDLRQLLTDSYHVLVEGPGCVFAGLIRESGQRPELVGLVERTMHGRRRFYLQVLNRAIARGDIAPETDLDLVIDLLLGPMWVRQLVTGDPIGPDLVDRIIALVTDGIPRPARPVEDTG